MYFTLGPYRLEVATEFGPRVTSLRQGDGPEILAALGPEAVLEHPGGTYRFHGGHRLWISPEVPAITYAPDDHECDVTEVSGTWTVAAPADAAGLVKQMALSADADALVVRHRLEQTGSGNGRGAPWAITQLPLGGTAIMPVRGPETGPSANRRIALWPYTSLRDPRLDFRDDVVLIEAGHGPQLKVGTGPAPGRLGYWRQGMLFVKDIESARDTEVPDFGAVGQVYIGQGFCELESVGGLVELARDGGATLEERWRVLACPDLETAVGMTVDGER